MSDGVLIMGDNNSMWWLLLDGSKNILKKYPAPECCAQHLRSQLKCVEVWPGDKRKSEVSYTDKAKKITVDDGTGKTKEIDVHGELKAK